MPFQGFETNIAEALVMLRVMELFVIAWVLFMVYTRPPSPELRKITAPAAFAVLVFNLVALIGAIWILEIYPA